MSYWRDSEFQEKLLAFVCRDRNFLRKTSGMLSPADFKPKQGEGLIEAFWLSEIAFKYWKEYREPIGGMLRTEVLDFIRSNKKKIGSKRRESLLELVEKIKRGEGLVAVEAIERKVTEYKQRKNKANAIRELIETQERGELTDSKFRRICKNALEFTDNAFKVSNYSNEDEIKRRIRRREKNRDRKFPYLYIDPLDKEVRTFPRGEMGVILAKYKTGKSTTACHLAHAYALQGYKVLLFTLEDNIEMVEDRLDASFAGIRMKYLFERSSKLKRRLRKAIAKLRADIKVVDGTEGGMTIQRIEEIWDNYRNQGFAADTILIDADEGVEPAEHFKGDNSEIKESKAIYIDAKQLAARRSLWIWMFAQTKRGKSGKRQMIITGDDSATDISKMRRCAMAIGIGDGPEEWGDDSRYLNIAIHRYDKMKCGWPIMGDFSRAIFYDKERTEKMLRRTKRHHDD